jgi:hypothetical protein
LKISVLRHLSSLALSVLLVTSSIAAEPQTARPSTYKGWKGYVLENDVVRLHVAPDIGGRVIQYALGEKEFFWVNPTLAGKQPPRTGLDPNGGWLNYGGDKLWPAPQGWDNDAQWPGPPDAVLDGQPYRAEIDRDRCAIHLTSRDDPRSGIRLTRRISLDPRSTRVVVKATMTIGIMVWAGSTPTTSGSTCPTTTLTLHTFSRVRSSVRTPGCSLAKALRGGTSGPHAESEAIFPCSVAARLDWFPNRLTVSGTVAECSYEGVSACSTWAGWSSKSTTRKESC